MKICSKKEDYLKEKFKKKKNHGEKKSHDKIPERKMWKLAFFAKRLYIFEFHDVFNLIFKNWVSAIEFKIKKALMRLSMNKHMAMEIVSICLVIWNSFWYGFIFPKKNTAISDNIEMLMKHQFSNWDVIRKQSLMFVLKAA